MQNEHSTHHVHRGAESLPCYCAATNDHAIGQEQPHLSRPYPDLLNEQERKEILSDAEHLWHALEANNLGGYSGHNRPFYILHAFKQVIEKYGKRDVGLTWSNDALDAARPPMEPTTEG